MTATLIGTATGTSVLWFLGVLTPWTFVLIVLCSWFTQMVADR